MWPYEPRRTRLHASATDWVARASRILGQKIDAPSPVSASGRNLAKKVWGRAWCEHLERYSDFSNRLPRGRTYLRNGSVVHLAVEPGRVVAVVLGSDVYVQQIDIRRSSEETKKKLAERCTGSIGATIDLLAGRLPADVLRSLSDPSSGLFPQPKAIDMECSCPDWAYLCKHLAAVLYGIGVRFDSDPGLLFSLRGIDPDALIGGATSAFVSRPPPPNRRLVHGDLAALFDVELELDAPDVPAGAVEEGEVDEEDELAVTRADLIELGVTPSKVQSWLKRGWLARASERGVYLPTEEGWAALEPYLSGAQGAGGG